MTSVLTDLAVAWRQESGTNRPAVENPLPLAESTIRNICGMITGHCARQGLSYQSLVERVLNSNMRLRDEFNQALEAVNTDVYGRWERGTLTQSDLAAFKRNLKTLEAATAAMLTSAGGGATGPPVGFSERGAEQRKGPAGKGSL